MRLALDVSNQNPASLETVKASGAKVLICKATEGVAYRDSTIAAHRKIAKTLGIRFGSYLFLHAGAGEAQAKAYKAYAKPAKGELVVIDAESGGLDGRTMKLMAATVWSAAATLIVAGHHPVLYASSSFWQQLILWEPNLAKLHVWEAQYPGRFTRWFPRLAALRVRLHHGVTVVLWQFTDSWLVNGHKYDASLILDSSLILPNL